LGANLTSVNSWIYRGVSNCWCLEKTIMSIRKWPGYWQCFQFYCI